MKTIDLRSDTVTRPAPETNMVMFRVGQPGPFHHAIPRLCLLINPIDMERFRAVLHLDVDSALQRMREAPADA